MMMNSNTTCEKRTETLNFQTKPQSRHYLFQLFISYCFDFKNNVLFY